MHSLVYLALVLTSSHPVKMRLKCKELFHGYFPPRYDLKKCAALVSKIMIGDTSLFIVKAVWFPVNI